MTLAIGWLHEAGDPPQPTLQVAPWPWRSGGSMRLAIASEPGSIRLAIGIQRI